MATVKAIDLSKAIPDPYLLALEKGESRFQIQAGGSTLVVRNAHPGLEKAWDYFEAGIDTPDRLAIALRALYRLICAVRGPRFADFE